MASHIWSRVRVTHRTTRAMASERDTLSVNGTRGAFAGRMRAASTSDPPACDHPACTRVVARVCVAPYHRCTIQIQTHTDLWCTPALTSLCLCPQVFAANQLMVLVTVVATSARGRTSRPYSRCALHLLTLPGSSTTDAFATPPPSDATLTTLIMHSRTRRMTTRTPARRKVRACTRLEPSPPRWPGAASDEAVRVQKTSQNGARSSTGAKLHKTDGCAATAAPPRRVATGTDTPCHHLLTAASACRGHAPPLPRRHATPPPAPLRRSPPPRRGRRTS